MFRIEVLSQWCQKNRGKIEPDVALISGEITEAIAGDEKKGMPEGIIYF